MNQDAPFRAALIVGFLAFVAVMLYYRIKSYSTGESLDRRQEGVFILATLRLVGLMLWLGVIAYMINPAWLAWSSVPLPAWLRWTGVGVYPIAVGLLNWTLRGLGSNLTDTVVTRREHTLVTRGPYRWVRHPFYDCLGLIILASSLIAANGFLFLAGTLFLVLIVVRTRTEEERLLARFGDDYRAYMKQTGRFGPRIGANRRRA
jgi:protein-S-isoprenylcysteine O-methyltransferase Ste14